MKMVSENASLPQSADTLEDARTLALHYQSVAAEQGTKILQLRWALLILREFSLAGNFSARVESVIRSWIDGGMQGPVPWPGGAFFEKWAAEKGLSNIDGFVGMRFTATANVVHPYGARRGAARL